MAIRTGRFDNLSHEECIALLQELEGPLLELDLSRDSCDVCSSDVYPEVFMALEDNPRLQLIFLTEEERESWKRFCNLSISATSSPRSSSASSRETTSVVPR